MVFTIVTIVFLPMSFIAAVFAIPVRDFPHRDGTPSIPFSYVSKIMFGVGLAISIPLIAVAFALDNLGLLFRRTLRSVLFWRTDRRDSVVRQGEPIEPGSEDEEPELVPLGRKSEDPYRGKLSYDSQHAIHPISKSMNSKDRSRRDNSDLRDRFRASRDLERGNE